MFTTYLETDGAAAVHVKGVEDIVGVGGGVCEKEGGGGG